MDKSKSREERLQKVEEIIQEVCILYRTSIVEIAIITIDTFYCQLKHTCFSTIYITKIQYLICSFCEAGSQKMCWHHDRNARQNQRDFWWRDEETVICLWGKMNVGLGYFNLEFLNIYSLFTYPLIFFYMILILNNENTDNLEKPLKCINTCTCMNMM